MVGSIQVEVSTFKIVKGHCAMSTTGLVDGTVTVWHSCCSCKSSTFIFIVFQVKELKAYMYCSSLKDLHLDEAGRANYTYKALGAGFWALRQKDFRHAIQDIVHEVIIVLLS